MQPLPRFKLRTPNDFRALAYNSEACIGVLGIQDICHFTSRDIGYNPFYFQGYRILCLIFPLLPGILSF